jgi:hypothetical protein
MEISGSNLILSTGEYTGVYTTPVRDIGYIATCKVGIDCIVTVAGDAEMDDFGDATIDSFETLRFTGEEAPNAVSYKIRYSDDNATWTAWETWYPADYTFRYFQLQLILTRTNLSQVLQCSQFDYYADLPDVDEYGTAEITVAADGVAITFTKEFHEVPSVNVDILDGDAYLHKFSVAPDLTGFTVKIYDLSGTAQTGNIRWHAHGV